MNAQFWVKTARLTADLMSQQDENQKRIAAIHQEASNLLSKGWKLQASHIYTAGDGHAWLYIWLVGP